LRDVFQMHAKPWQGTSTPDKEKLWWLATH